jgi:hypothetical protein
MKQESGQNDVTKAITEGKCVKLIKLQNPRIP